MDNQKMDAIAFLNLLKKNHLLMGNDDKGRWGRLYSTLLEIPDAPYTTFIRLEYFRDCKGSVDRFQDIPDKYKIYKNPEKLFVSHKWETREHPDVSRKTLNQLLSLTQDCNDDTAIWWDFCSLPQRDKKGYDDRSSELKEFFKNQLSIIPLVILDSQSMFLWSEEGINSGWCCAEILIAQALMQHLNKMIYRRRKEFDSPPLFAAQVENETRIQSDLARFDYRLFQKIYSGNVAIEKHDEMITWLNEHVTGGEPTPYSQILKKVTPDLITQMISELGLHFTNSADKEVVSKMLYTIYNRLSLSPFDSFQWDGKRDFFQMWHYVRGCLGSCLVPHVHYSF